MKTESKLTNKIIKIRNNNQKLYINKLINRFNNKQHWNIKYVYSIQQYKLLKKYIDF